MSPRTGDQCEAPAIEGPYCRRHSPEGRRRRSEAMRQACQRKRNLPGQDCEIRASNAKAVPPTGPVDEQLDPRCRPHYWYVDARTGAGRCKKCGSTKQFDTRLKGDWA